METFTVYKFTYEKYAKKLISGESIRIGSVSYFRGMDYPGSAYYQNLENNPFDEDAHSHLNPQGGIDDPYEGRTVVHTGEMRSWYPDHQLSAKVTADKLGIDIFGLFGSGGYTTVRNNLYVLQVPNYYIFCTSSYINSDIIERIKNDSRKYSANNEAYDVVIPIVDSIKFVLRLQEALCRLKGIEDFEMGGFIFQPVVYEDRIYKVGDQNSQGPDPFVKNTFFKNQEEYRFLFNYEIPDEEKFVDVSIEGDIANIFGDPISI